MEIKKIHQINLFSIEYFGFVSQENVLTLLKVIKVISTNPKIFSQLLIYYFEIRNIIKQFKNFKFVKESVKFIRKRQMKLEEKITVKEMDPSLG